MGNDLALRRLYLIGQGVVFHLASQPVLSGGGGLSAYRPSYQGGLSAYSESYTVTAGYHAIHKLHTPHMGPCPQFVQFHCMLHVSHVLPDRLLCFLWIYTFL